MAGLASAAAFLVYLPVLQNKFVNLWDDNWYICNNPHIRSLNSGFLKWAIFGLHVSNWQPLTWISYAIDYSIWGLDPSGFHLTNIILHAANTFIVVVLVTRLIEVWEERKRQSVWGQPPVETSSFSGNEKLIVGTVAGLLFGLHPLHVESVAWASERKDVLCGLFFLLSILAYIKYAARSGGPRSELPFFLERRYHFSLALFTLALMSKPMAVSLPLVLLILDWYPLGRIKSVKTFRAAFLEKIPFFVLSGGVSVLTLIAQKKGGSITPIKALPLSDRALVAARSLVLYIWKTVFPLDLSPLYPYPKTISFLSASFFLPVLCVMAVTALCLFSAKRQRLWLACWSYYVITLLPVLGIVQVGKQSMADRYTYLPGLGLSIAAGISVAWAWRRLGAHKGGRALRISGAAFAFLIVVSMAYLTGRQIGVWKSNLAFWNSIIEREPGKVPFAYINRGNVFNKMGQSAKAISDYSEAIALDPFRAEAYYNRGIEFAKTGQSGKAIADYIRAIALKPDYADAYNNLGTEFGEKGQFVRAILAFKKAIALEPAFYGAYHNLAEAYKKTGRFDLAIKELDKAIALDRPDADAYKELGNIFAQEKQTGKAISSFNKAILLNPGSAGLYAGRGRVYRAIGERRLAASDFRKACAMGDAEGCRALRKAGF